MKANPFAISRNIDKFVFPLIEQSLDVFYALARESDRVIYRPKTLADGFADQIPDKIIRATVIPANQPTRAFPNPMLSGFAIPASLNKLSYRFYKLPARSLLRPIRHFRQKHGLPLRSPDISSPYLYGISPHFLETPRDWPGNHILSGFWVPPRQQTISPKIREFLENGPPPLLVTFGSTPFHSHITIPDLVQMIYQKFGVRMLLVKGWDEMPTAQLAENPDICVVNSVPYNLILPQVRAVIHHGGIGTIAECLRAGKPMLPCPVLYPIGDQMFWGKQAYKRGVAVYPLPIKKIRPGIFLQKVRQLLENTSLYAHAEALQVPINQEDGLRQAVEILENRLKLKNMGC